MIIEDSESIIRSSSEELIETNVLDVFNISASDIEDYKVLTDKTISDGYHKGLLHNESYLRILGVQSKYAEKELSTFYLATRKEIRQIAKSLEETMNQRTLDIDFTMPLDERWLGPILDYLYSHRLAFGGDFGPLGLTPVAYGEYLENAKEFVKFPRTLNKLNIGLYADLLCAFDMIRKNHPPTLDVLNRAIEIFNENLASGESWYKKITYIDITYRLKQICPDVPVETLLTRLKGAPSLESVIDMVRGDDLSVKIHRAARLKYAFSDRVELTEMGIKVSDPFYSAPKNYASNFPTQLII